MDLYIVHPETRAVIKACVPNFLGLVRAARENTVILVPQGHVYNPTVKYPTLSFDQVLLMMKENIGMILEREEPEAPRAMAEAIHELGLDIETCAGGCEFLVDRSILQYTNPNQPVDMPPEPPRLFRNSPPAGVIMK